MNEAHFMHAFYLLHSVIKELTLVVVTKVSSDHYANNARWQLGYKRFLILIDKFQRKKRFQRFERLLTRNDCLWPQLRNISVRSLFPHVACEMCVCVCVCVCECEWVRVWWTILEMSVLNFWWEVKLKKERTSSSDVSNWANDA